MSNPFYSVHVVNRMGDDFVPHQEVYLLGPQFCGGDKFVIANVFLEKLADAETRDDDLPKIVRGFLDWVRETAVTPALRKTKDV